MGLVQFIGQPVNRTFYLLINPLQGLARYTSTYRSLIQSAHLPGKKCNESCWPPKGIPAIYWPDYPYFKAALFITGKNKKSPERPSSNSVCAFATTTQLKGKGYKTERTEQCPYMLPRDGKRVLWKRGKMPKKGHFHKRAKNRR